MMSRERSTYKNLTLIKLICIKRFSYLVGGVLLASLLALVPYKVHASSITSIDSYRTTLGTFCEVENVDSVRVLIGPQNPSGIDDFCGRGITGSNKSYIYLDYNRSEGSSSIVSSASWTTWRDRLSSSDYFLQSSAVVNVRGTIPNNAFSNNAYRSTLDDSKYSNLALAYIVSPDSSTSGFTPVIDFSKFAFFNSSGQAITGSAKNEKVKQIQDDTYQHSTYGCNPDILNPDFSHNNFIFDAVRTVLYNNFVEDGDSSVGANLCVFSAYIPHYSDFTWQISSAVGGNTQINVYTLGYSYPTKINNSLLDGLSWTPAMIVNPYYTSITSDASAPSVWRALQAYNFGSPFMVFATCDDNDTSCNSSMSYGANSAFNDHSEVITYESGNPAFSWFNVFGINLILPFDFLFNSFSSNSCVSTPTINSWLHRPINDQYCNWWPSDIRNTLTPVFMLASTMLLFGFIMSWLRDSDAIHDSRKEF